MRLKGYSFLLVVAVSLCLLVSWRVRGQAPSFTGVVYEYKVIRIVTSEADVEKRLNELGGQRWELVAVQSEPGKDRSVYYLKRQINIVAKG
jgi:hypothetical protein